MISILIPTYNYVCVTLVSSLAQQAEVLKSKLKGDFDFEIIVADDGSTDQKSLLNNRPINDIPQCRFAEHGSNIGRALICNWLIEQSRFDHLLIIDSDALVCRDDFLEKYWTHRTKADFICGTIQNLDRPCPTGYELRYRYEQQAERKRSKTDLNANPYFRLSTFNLFLDKRKLGNLRFDNRCSEYGYEDALLGLTLQERGISILHIDNPLIHNGIDSNVSFLSKTEAAMRTLSRLDGIMQQYAGTSRMYSHLCHLHVIGLFRSFFILTRRAIRANLLGRHPSLFLFQLYKLGYYANLNK